LRKGVSYARSCLAHSRVAVVSARDRHGLREEVATTEERLDWAQARREAFLQDAIAVFTDRPTDLLSFEEVRQKLRLRNARYLGLQDVPLDQIVGSVDRYQDFNRAFLPRREFLEKRWERVSRLVGGPDALGLPPVELYKVGDAYFVHDGNHRVSVARQHGTPAIQAYVWEYDVRVPLGPDADIDDLLCTAAQVRFLGQTDVDRLCPDLSIEVTQPDGYDYLLYEIEAFQRVIARIDGREVPFDEAVALWCDMAYSPIVEIIRRRGILKDFPTRTETDLYLWLRRNQEELNIRHGREILMEEAADDLAERFGERFSSARRVARTIGRLAEGVGELGGRLLEGVAGRDRVQEERAEQLAQALLAPICEAAHRVPRYRFDGTSEAEWQTWHAEFRERLWNLLGAGERPRQVYGPDRLDATVVETETVSGIRREVIELNTEGGLRLPVYMFIPPGADGPRPAIAVFPGHGTIEQTAGPKRSYQRRNALELARAGFVTLTMELRGFGWLDAVEHLRIDAAAKLVGRTWYGLLVCDAMHAIDYLLTRPEVDPTRIGATGIGSGGALTMYTAALDDRVRAVLVHSYLGKYVVTCFDEEHCPCNDIPGMRRDAEMGDVAALLAPRPALFVNGLRDPLTTLAGRESFGIVRRVYALLGVPQRVRLIEPEGLGHTYDVELAAAWFRRWLAAKRPG